MKYKGYAYLDKTGRLHLLEENGKIRTMLDKEIKSGYYEVSLSMETLTRPKMEDAFFVFTRSKMKE